MKQLLNTKFYNLSPACAPTFEFNPVKKQLLGAEDGRVVIECKPRAAPRPRFTWTKGKELLFNNSRSVQVIRKETGHNDSAIIRIKTV